MVPYGLEILHLIQELRKAHPGVTQAWYEDGNRTGGIFKVIRRHIEDLMVQGPPRGCFLEPTKSVLVVSPQNLPRAEAFFRGYRFHIMMGGRYLGGFVGSKEAQDCCLGDKMKGCRDSVAKLAGVAH